MTLLHSLSVDIAETKHDIVAFLGHCCIPCLVSCGQRPAVAPMKFLAASKPPWFIQGQQQDCSEFLKFLLDQIHEQQLESTKKEAKMANGIVPNGIVANGSPMKCKDPTGRTGNNAASESAPNGLSVNGVEPANITDSHPGGDSGKDSTLVREVFGGKVRSTLRCLSCKQESHRVEEFIDIPLAFPEVGSSSSSSPISPKSLVGGGAHLPQGDLPKHQESAVVSISATDSPTSPLDEPTVEADSASCELLFF